MSTPSSRLPRIIRALRLRQLFRWWGARTLAASGLSYVFDLSTLFTTVRLLGVRPSLGTMMGVFVGWTSSFFLNRRFAFRTHHHALAPQALRFGATAIVAMSLQGWLVGFLVDRFDVPLFVAKVGSDAGLFAVGLPLVFRYLVFRKHRTESAPAPVVITEASEK